MRFLALCSRGCIFIVWSFPRLIGIREEKVNSYSVAGHVANALSRVVESPCCAQTRLILTD